MMVPARQSATRPRDGSFTHGARTQCSAFGKVAFAFLFVLAAFLAFSFPAAAQLRLTTPKVSIVAGKIELLERGTVVVASDGVTIHSRDQIIATERLTYNQTTGELLFDEPLTLVTEDGVVVAQLATLSEDLEDGVIRSVQFLTRHQLQLAATSMHLNEGRYRILTNAVASSCHICRNGEVPDWQVRAETVLHDVEEQRIYFENAVVEVAGVPVLSVPYLSIPGPNVDRATGFLVPTIVTSTVLGTGFKLPYYITRSDHEDITLTPFITTEGGAVLETEYRRNYKSGTVQIDGALLLAGGIGDDRLASYVSGQGQFELPRDFRLSFDSSVASNKRFTNDYDIDDRDRLVSEIDVERTRSESYLGFGASLVQSLRLNEVDQQVPLVLPEVHYRWITRPAGNLGTFGLRTHVVNLTRRKDNRLFRFGTHLDWTKGWQVGNGFQIGAFGEIVGLGYRYDNYPPRGSGSTGSVEPVLALEARWPLARTASPGVRHRLEPIIQLVWRPDEANDAPNEDSQLIEFEAANLFSLNRFPGHDRKELGLTANVGARYSILDESGFSLDAMAGQVFRDRDLGQFADEPGLSGQSSDYVFSLDVSHRDRFSFTTTGVFDRNLSFSKFEQVASVVHGRFEFDLNYVSLTDNETTLGEQPSRELIGSARYNITENSQLRGSLRRNLVSRKTTEAEVGFRIQNECTLIDFFFSLDAAGTGSEDDDRQIGVTVELLGLSGTLSGSGRPPIQCGMRI